MISKDSLSSRSSGLLSASAILCWEGMKPDITAYGAYSPTCCILSLAGNSLTFFLYWTIQTIKDLYKCLHSGILSSRACWKLYVPGVLILVNSVNSMCHTYQNIIPDPFFFFLRNLRFWGYLVLLLAPYSLFTPWGSWNYRECQDQAQVCHVQGQLSPIVPTSSHCIFQPLN